MNAAHIISLTATNVKKVKAVRIEPDPKNPLVLVGGENDAGKSSVLDAILSVLGGKDASPAVPVRKGHKRGEVILDLGELVAKVRFTAAGGRELIVEDKEGHKLPSPQAVMDKLTGKVGFDAEDFIRKPAPEQLAILRRIVGVDFKPIDDKKKSLFDQRTLINSEVRRLEAQLAISPNPTDAPDQLVESSAVLEELQKAQNANAEIDGEFRKADEAASAWCRTEDDLRNLRHTLMTAESDLADLTKQVDGMREQEKLLMEQSRAHQDKSGEIRKKAASCVKVDTEPLTQKIVGADVANTKFRQASARKTLTATLRQQEAAASALTNKIEECDAEKQRILEAAKFPVPGLSFTEDGILFDGLPFSQASSSTKRRVSVAIGAALNPTLRVMVIKDGSLIDKKSMEQLRTLAAEHDLQVWIEMVTSGPDARCTVIIEDGCVQGAPAVDDTSEHEQPARSDTIVDPEPPGDLFSNLPSQ